MCPIFTDLGGIRGGGGRTRRTRRGSGIQTHTRTQIGLSSLARTTNSIEVARKDLSVEVPRKDRRIESKRSRRVKRPRLIEVQAKDPKVEVQAKDQRLIEVTKEIPRIQQGDRVIQDLGSMVGFPTWGKSKAQVLSQFKSNLRSEPTRLFIVGGAKG